MNLDALHDHQQEHHRIATSALRKIAENWRQPYPVIRDRFISGDHPVTAEFWRLVNARYPGQFFGADWFQCCRKFGLKIRLAS